jgi:hypothetical protein
MVSDHHDLGHHGACFVVCDCPCSRLNEGLSRSSFGCFRTEQATILEVLCEVLLFICPEHVVLTCLLHALSVMHSWPKVLRPVHSPHQLPAHSSRIGLRPCAGSIT